MTVKIYSVMFLVGDHQGLERTRRVYLCIYHLGQLYEEATLCMFHTPMLQFRPDRI
jgi:hypothetical protein